MLIDVITRVAEDTGWDLVQQRRNLLDIVNAAASEMYKELECNRIYREVTVLAPRDKVISLPSIIGELRGTRQHTSEVRFDVRTMSSPRYVNDSLQYKWKNWRDLGDAALARFPASVDTLTFESSVLEGAVIKIAGQTPTALYYEETITLDESPKESVALWTTNIQSISSLSTRTADITVKDSAGNTIAILYNNQRATRYKIIDVSQLFWSQDTPSDETLVDILYKIPLVKMLNDTDQFPSGDDYDDAWYNRAMALHFEPMQGREADAARHRGLSLSLMKSVKQSGEGNDVKKMHFGRNKFFGLFNRGRWMPGSITNVDNTVQ